MRYRKDDVTFHAEAWREGHAAVNVKDHGSYREHVGALERALEDLGLVVNDLDALAEAINEDDASGTWSYWASEDGWEQAAELAEETFGKGYDVMAEGRSSGWLVVTYNRRATFTADEVAGWDAIALARWARFEARVRLIADDQPFRVAWGYLANSPDAKPTPSMAGTGVGL